MRTLVIQKTGFFCPETEKLCNNTKNI
jgi:hypothetical protein